MNKSEIARPFTMSVAMCTHNGGRFIQEQISSIAQQSTKIDEIVLSDDNSTDRTVRLAQEALQRDTHEADPSPSLVVKRNTIALGVTKNFEQAISLTSGELIFLSDQDDIWSKEKLQRQLVTALGNPDAWLFFTNATVVNHSGVPLGYSLFDALELSRRERRLIRQGQVFEVLLRRNIVTGATVLLRRELFELARPFPSAWLHDEWLAVVAASRGKAACLDECLIAYRQHEANVVGQRKLSVRQKATRFSESLASRSARLLLRAEQLEEFLKQAPDTPVEYLELARRKRLFEEARSTYPSLRILRAPQILYHLIAGDYFRFGTGLKDAARNLFQPK